MLSLALIERRIKELTRGEHTDDAVKEFAIMCLARDYLLAEISEQEDKKKATGKPRIILTNYCADLNTIPTVEQIGIAIRSAAHKTTNPKDRESLAAAQTWADILGEKS